MGLTLFDLLKEDDFVRLKMGRLTGDEEQEVRQMLRGTRLGRIFGAGTGRPDLRYVAPFSSRPATASGGHTFTFSHRTASKGGRREVPLDRLYIRRDGPSAPGNAVRLRRHGARWDPKVSIEGSKGAWWIGAGDRAPEGYAFASEGAIVPAGRGFRPSMPAAKQRYIERPDGLEVDAAEKAVSVGNIAETRREREAFWKQVVNRERADGRVQSQFIAELPHEPEIGTAGRKRILETLGAEIGALGLRWHGVVHKPDEHGDQRNYHLHLLYHERGAERDEDGDWRFTRTKSPVTRERGFVKQMRHRYAEIVNAELERAGIERRFDARPYREMGIEKQPGRHMGSAAHALERRGVVTEAGRFNFSVEAMYRMLEPLRRVGRLAERDRRIIDEGRLLTAGLRDSRSARVTEAIDRSAATAEAVVEAGERLRNARGASDVAAWRSADVTRRARRLLDGRQQGDEIASEASAFLGRMAPALRQRRLEAHEERVRAGRDYRRRARDYLRTVGLVRAEQMLHQRDVLIAEREFAERSLADDHLVRDEWRRREASEDTETAQLREDRARVVRGLADRLEPDFSGTRLQLEANLLKPAYRNELGATAGPEDRDLRAGLQKLDEIGLRLAALEGNRRRRARIEMASEGEGRSSGGGLTTAEKRELGTIARNARKRLDEIDEEISDHGPSRRLAETRGLGARLGQDGWTALQTARAARVKSAESDATQIRNRRRRRDRGQER